MSWLSSKEPPIPLTKYEYQREVLSSDKLVAELNKHGEDRWDVMSISDSYWHETRQEFCSIVFFKRLKSDPIEYLLKQIADRCRGDW